MLRSMYSGIAGMRNFQTKLDVIGNNIANVNTFGYKKGRVVFKDLMSQSISGASTPTDNRGGTNPAQVGLGATMAAIDMVATQGSLQTTGRQLDLAINGDGFFVVNRGGLNMYTRAGNFYLDQQGTLVTADGYKVQGYQVREDGTIDPLTLGEIKVDTNAFMSPKATTQVSMVGNLNASAEIPTSGPTSTPITSGTTPLSTQLTSNETSMDLKVRDSLGNEHDIRVIYTKTANNTWDYEAYRVDFSTGVYGDRVTNGTGGTLAFDSTGKLSPAPASTIEGFTISAAALNNGADNLAVNFNFDSISQVSGSSTIAVGEKDGNGEGYIESFNIGASGEVVGVFSNGEVQVLSQIGVATFANNGGLTKSGNNYFTESNNSGVAKIGFAGIGRGSIQSAALEMSNVDLSEEFTEMITAQRGFQANTRIITTSDEILQELVNLKR
ncbi:flagellar basal-body rod protein FlgF [Bacillus salitolerans]|uniref:Flagellar hook protein FlgE n=1 Tax=Bacillus salitolerans TaxID=1437434 RepID=A0ABW4LMW7_9BACI